MMNKLRAIGVTFLRGLRLGLLVTFINAASLPFLLDLAVRIRVLYNEGIWISDPWEILGLWPIFLGFGAIYSFLPSMAAGFVLAVCVRGPWAGEADKKWLGPGVGIAVGVVAAVSYVLLVFFDPIFVHWPILNFQEHSLVAVFIFIEQGIVYGWLGARLGLRRQAR